MARKVYIAQLKCPNNHCVVGMAREFDSAKDADVLATMLWGGFEAAIALGAVKRECGICLSRDLRADVAATRFKTMEEAEPFLRQSERDQAETAALLRGSRN